MSLYLGLVHYPVYNKNGDTIASAITTLDLHDLARMSRTYGVRRFFVITPLADQQALAGQVIRHWTSGWGAGYNPNRKEAMESIEVVSSMDDAAESIRSREGRRPCWIATDAAPGNGQAVTFTAAGALLAHGDPVLLLLGTAWGLHRDVLERADLVLEPILGVDGYNHLPVRAAAAVMLDRLIFAAGRDPEESRFPGKDGAFGREETGHRDAVPE
jgi:hypothetical protein